MSHPKHFFHITIPQNSIIIIIIIMNITRTRPHVSIPESEERKWWSAPSSSVSDRWVRSGGLVSATTTYYYYCRLLQSLALLLQQCCSALKTVTNRRCWIQQVRGLRNNKTCQFFNCCVFVMCVCAPKMRAKIGIAVMMIMVIVGGK